MSTGQPPVRLMTQAEVAESMDWTAFHDVLLDTAKLSPGQRVLDVGCGFGATTRRAAAQVAPGGSVLGIDNSAEMIRRAREESEGTGVELLEADAQTHRFGPASFDVVISAFGLMFFHDPEAAFGNIRSALRPGGLLASLSWREMAAADYFVAAREAMAPVVGPPPDPPRGRGPFFLSDPERIADFLRGVGLVDVEVRAVTRRERVGRTLDEAVRVVATIPVIHSVLAAAEPGAAAAAVAAVREALRPHAEPGGVMSEATVWLATARNA